MDKLVLVLIAVIFLISAGVLTTYTYSTFDPKSLPWSEDCSQLDRSKPGRCGDSISSPFASTANADCSAINAPSPCSFSCHEGGSFNIVVGRQSKEAENCDSVDYESVCNEASYNAFESCRQACERNVACPDSQVTERGSSWACDELRTVFGMTGKFMVSCDWQVECRCGAPVLE